jgi:hypothetical protein
VKVQGKQGGGHEVRGIEWMKRCRKISWQRRTMDCRTRKGKKVRGVRIGIRK